MFRATFACAALAVAAVTFSGTPASGAGSKATLALKNDGHRDAMTCTLYQVAEWSNNRKRSLGQFTVPGRDNLPAAERDRYKTFQVTLPNRPLAKKKGVKTLPSDSYRPRLQLFCRQGSNNNHWAWGPIWKTSDKPVQQWRQEAICRDGSPCGVSFAAIDSL